MSLPNTTSQVARPSTGASQKSGSVARTQIGDTVFVRGSSPGTIAFLGGTKLATGEWAGVILDDAIGKNDGSVTGVRYFRCEPWRGLFCPISKRSRTPSILTGHKSEVDGNCSTTPASKRPTTSSHHGASIPPRPSAKFNKDEAASIKKSQTAGKTSGDKHSLHLGDRVLISGTLRYVGTVEFAKGEYAGVELDDPLGKSDGAVAGKRYFECKPKYGLFVPVKEVTKMSRGTKLSPLMRNLRNTSKPLIQESPPEVGAMDSIFTGPQPLVFTDPERGTLSLNQKVLDELSTVTKNINSVAIAGLYRTGKSYLLTRLAGRYKGFALGCTIESKTKGIWAWCVDHPKHADQALLLLDTEGLGDVRKGDTNDDNKLFTLAILLSSTLIYNMLGKFDDDALNKLNFITEMSRSLKTSDTATDDDNFDMYFPDFILALRDFTLILEKDGEEITADEYLEYCLEAKEGDSEEIKRFNEPRLCIRKYFKNRKCFVFESPAPRRKLRHLENLSDSDLNPGFVEDTQSFLHHAFNCCESMKTTKGFNVSGRMFSSLAKCYVQAIAQGAIPSIESALKSMAKIENEAAFKESCDIYVQEMKNNAILPTKDAQSLRDKHIHSADLAFKHFIKRRVLDDDSTYKDKLDLAINTEYDTWVGKDKAESTKRCEEELLNLHNKIKAKITDGGYAVSGGYGIYTKDFEEMKRNYDAKQGLGVMKGMAFVQYEHYMWSEAETIMKADQTISENERVLESEQNSKKITENRLEVIKEQLELSKTDLTEREKQHKEVIKTIQESNSMAAAAEKAKMNKVLEQRTEEIRRQQTEKIQNIQMVNRKDLEIQNLKNQKASSDNMLQQMHQQRWARDEQIRNMEKTLKLLKSELYRRDHSCEIS